MEEEYRKLNKALDVILIILNKDMNNEKRFVVSTVNDAFSKLPSFPFKKRRSQIYRPLSQNEIISIVLGFYKQLDPEYYQMAKNIIINKDNNISIVLYDEKTKELLPNDFDFPKYSKDGSKILTKYDELQIDSHQKPRIIQTNRGKIYIELEGNIQDAYVLAHELAHVMGIDPNSYKQRTETRPLFDEINPVFIEYLLNDYLEKKGLITEKEKYSYVFEQYKRDKKTADINDLRIQLAKRKEKNKDIKKADLKEILKKNQYIPDDSVLAMHIKRISNFSEPLMTRYILANLAGTYLYSIYLRDPEKAMKMQKDFTNAHKDDDFSKIFLSLQLKMDFESISKLAICKNQQLKIISKKLDLTNDKELIEK